MLLDNIIDNEWSYVLCLAQLLVSASNEDAASKA